MPPAVLSAAPMPWPISRYHDGLAAAGSRPPAFHSASPAASVPDLSPRDTNGLAVSLLALKAASTSLLPLIPAGSAFGPITTKSLYITSKHFTPKPSATNLSSCGLACTNTTSASPRLPVSSAWPVPCAITFTSMPVLLLNSGRMWPNSPESWVDVVEATTIDFSWAGTGVETPASSTRPTKAWISFMIGSFLDQQFAGDELFRFRRARRREELLRRRVLDDAAAVHQHDRAGEPARLAEVVGRHHDLDAARRD